MGRPPLDVGTYGNITIHPRGDKYMATARFRDYDGRTRLVAKYGDSEAKAERALKKAMVERQRTTGTDITSDTSIKALADIWWKSFKDTDKASGTKRVYLHSIDNHIKPSLGGLRLRECSTGAVDRALKKISARSGPAAAKMTRTVLAGMLGLAMRHDAITVNPVRDTGPISRLTKKGRPRALTPAEVDYITDRARADDFAVNHDLPDLIDWMLFTGCRIGEACAARRAVNTEGKQILDLDAGTWEVNATVIRETGTGLLIQPRTKSDAGWRVLALPPTAVEMVRRRDTEARFKPPHGVILGSPSGHLRDPSNSSGDLRVYLDSLDCEACGHRGYHIVNKKRVRCAQGPYSWVVPHTFRKTVATRLEEAGLTPRQVADQLGHSKPSMTQDVYFGRNVVNSEAARVLDR